MLRSLLLLASLAPALLGMSADEFKALYENPNKTADTCYELYQAYKDGDGVEQSDTHARKWLLAAHACGKENVRGEIAKLPWRSKLKVKTPIPVAEVDDAKAEELGKELINTLHTAYGSTNNTRIQAEPAALSKEQIKEVRKLIRSGADLNAVVFDGNNPRTALYLACLNMDLATAKLLIESGADPSACSNLAIEPAFLKVETPKGASLPPAMRGKVRGKDKARKTKAKEANAEATLFKFLVKNGADLNMWTNYGWSTAYLAAFGRSAAAIDWLKESGVDLDARQNPAECVPQKDGKAYLNYRQGVGYVKDKGNAFNFAAANSEDEVAKALIKHGVATDLKQGGQTPAQYIEECLAHSTNEEFNARYRSILNAIKAAAKTSDSEEN